MLQEMGFCNGIENYSRHLSGRPPGSKPFTLLDFFPKDFLLVIDESHATIPQIGGMYEGDKSRKTVLVEYGFRLPSALDNRPLNFSEFMVMANQLVYVSATPAEFEMEIRQLQRNLHAVAVAYSRVAFDIAKRVGHIRLDAEAWSKRIFELHAWRVFACPDAIAKSTIEVVEPNFRIRRRRLNYQWVREVKFLFLVVMLTLYQ